MTKIKKYTAEQLAVLSETKLESAYKTISALNLSLCDEFIVAGRGMERPSDIITKDDPLSLRYIEISDVFQSIVDEERRRKTYHGSLKPIRVKKLRFI